MVDAAMQVKKTKCEAEGNRDWDVEGKLAEADAPIAPAQAQVESDAGKAAYREKGVEAGIEKSELAEESELVGPRRLQPAQIDRQTERDENQKVDEVTVLVGVERCRQPLQRGEDDRRKEIKQQPADGKVVQTNGDEEPGNRQHCRQGQAQSRWKRLRRANAALAREGKGKQRNEQEHQRDRGWNDGEGQVHAFIVNWGENWSGSPGRDGGIDGL